MPDLMMSPGVVDEPTTPTAAPRMKEWRPRRFTFGGLAIWIVLALLIILPVMCFLILAVSPRMFSQGPQWFTLTYIRQAFEGYTLRGIVNSLWVSTTVAVLATAGATALAWLVQRTNLGARRLWSVSMWLLLLMPTWIMAQGWTDLLQPYGVADALGINLSWLYGEFFGPFGIIVVLISTSLPFAFFIVSAGLRGLGPEFEDAARIHGATRVQTMKTVLPIIAPAILGALAISFAETISDFGVADTLGYHAHFPLATYTLFSAISNFPANFSVAAVIAGVLILATVPPIALQSIVTRKSKAYGILSGRTRTPKRREFRPGPRAAVTAAVGFFVFVALGVPIIGAVAGSFVQNLGEVGAAHIHFTLSYFAQVFHPSIENDGLGSTTHPLQSTRTRRLDRDRNSCGHPGPSHDGFARRMESADHRRLSAGVNRHSWRGPRSRLHLLLRLELHYHSHHRHLQDVATLDARVGGVGYPGPDPLHGRSGEPDSVLAERGRQGARSQSLAHVANHEPSSYVEGSGVGLALDIRQNDLGTCDVPDSLPPESRARLSQHSVLHQQLPARHGYGDDGGAYG